MDAAQQYALAYALTATAGLRGVLSLALVAIAAHFNVIHPNGEFGWLTTPAVMWMLIAVAAFELGAVPAPQLVRSPLAPVRPRPFR